MNIVIPYDGYEHLGLGYLSAVARERGHSVQLFPMDSGDYIRGTRTLSARSLGKAVNRIAALSPDIVAFSLNSFRAGEYIRLAGLIRGTGIKTIAGGPHASAEPSLVMQSEAFDALVAGEAESVFADALEHTVLGSGAAPPWLWTKDHAARVPPPTPPLDGLPFPAKDLFYRIAPFESRDYKIITSRGCAYRCIFCSHSGPAVSPGIRRRGVDDVVRELRWAKRTFNPSTVYFLDDNFPVNVDWLKDFLHCYRHAVGIPFHAILHPSNCNEAVARMLKEAFCFKVRLGVQSLTPRIKKFLGRPEGNEQVGRAIACIRNAGMIVEVDHMVNLPGETLEEAREGISWYNTHRPDAVKVYWLMPLPGTEWFARARTDGRISESTAREIRLGRGFGSHSYLFYGREGYCDHRWLGIHALLVYLPYLPAGAVAFLLRIRGDRFLRIRSFLLLVGVSRLLAVLRGGDRVGETHIRRLWRTYAPARTPIKLKEDNEDPVQ